MIIDIYSLLKKSSVKGVTNISVRALSRESGLTTSKIRTMLNKLENEGCIVRERQKNKNGADMSTKITVKKKPELMVNNVNTKLALKIKDIYCLFSNKRIGYNLYSKNSFHGYINNFITIAEICIKKNFNSYIYVASCFNTFSQTWCEKTFNNHIPPPYILSSKAKADERYNGFFRKLTQIRFANEMEDLSQEELIKNDIKIWEQIGKTKDYDVLLLFVENEMLSALFVCFFLPNNKKEKFMAEHNLDIVDVLDSEKIISKGIK